MSNDCHEIGMDEKLFEDDYRRRLKMFRPLIESIALYGAENGDGEMIPE